MRNGQRIIRFSATRVALKVCNGFNDSLPLYRPMKPLDPYVLVIEGTPVTVCGVGIKMGDPVNG